MTGGKVLISREKGEREVLIAGRKRQAGKQVRPT